MSAQPDSISHGTHREEDLIPAFIDALCGGADDRLGNARQRAALWENLALGLLNKPATEQQQFVSEFLFDFLWEKLNAIAPAGHYFGTLEGDGSDYGFWPLPEETDEDR